MMLLNKIFTMIGVFLIIVSICMFLYNNHDEEFAGTKSQEILDIIKPITVDANEKEEQKEMSVINIDGYDYIGRIIIPVINLELPVMSECDKTRLKISPCRYYGSLYINNLIICAHAYKTQFKSLNDLNIGDKIVFVDIRGKIYNYEVKKIEILNYKDISNMIDSKYNLTLYTCTNDGYNRLTIRCNLI